MMILFSLHLLLILLGAVKAVELPKEDSGGLKIQLVSSDPERQESDSIKMEKGKRVYKSRCKPKGYHKQETMRVRKIVELLAEKGNGIYNYEKAKKLADQCMLKYREQNAQKTARYKAKLKLKGIEYIRPTKFKRPAGYSSIESKIARRQKSFLRHDPSLTEGEARKNAEYLIRLQKDKLNKQAIERRAKRRAEKDAE